MVGREGDTGGVNTCPAYLQADFGASDTLLFLGFVNARVYIFENNSAGHKFANNPGSRHIRQAERAGELRARDSGIFLNFGQDHSPMRSAEAGWRGALIRINNHMLVNK